MIYYPRDDITENDKKLSLNPETNIYLSKFEPTPYSVKLHEARSVIASREFDILVYLDLYVVFECEAREFLIMSLKYHCNHLLVSLHTQEL